MNVFSSPSPIVITPVNNGWVVTMPPPPQQPFNETSLAETMLDVAKKVKDSFQSDDEIQQIRDKAKVKEFAAEPPPFTRDQNVMIFTTFSEVLAFLKVTIDEN